MIETLLRTFLLKNRGSLQTGVRLLLAVRTICQYEKLKVPWALRCHLNLLHTNVFAYFQIALPWLNDFVHFACMN